MASVPLVGLGMLDGDTNMPATIVRQNVVVTARTIVRTCVRPADQVSVQQYWVSVQQH